MGRGEGVVEGFEHEEEAEGAGCGVLLAGGGRGRVLASGRTDCIRCTSKISGISMGSFMRWLGSETLRLGLLS